MPATGWPRQENRPRRRPASTDVGDDARHDAPSRRFHDDDAMGAILRAALARPPPPPRGRGAQKRARMRASHDMATPYDVSRRCYDAIFIPKRRDKSSSFFKAPRFPFSLPPPVLYSFSPTTYRCHDDYRRGGDAISALRTANNKAHYLQYNIMLIRASMFNNTATYKVPLLFMRY